MLNRGEYKMHFNVYMDKEPAASEFNEFASPNAVESYSSARFLASPSSEGEGSLKNLLSSSASASCTSGR